ncbi:hypothetical protein ACRE_090860 [Hapsidospora chrysogenum ATCC 11550]|uniref:Uncharacterized protein n=1 Tax=Hapsidospora chrysogenum (strain ATCC 11550 / CBS 779.69 / DSM 880 / IAM 14645 / JCM 23072 / IMI 49137) TaxID=857340 RepID=A0A086ST25_HAPC1|nr:hypothetical protein ACRE_090860 [Hapsidospora chrysogenum ATCC 11550]
MASPTVINTRIIDPNTDSSYRGDFCIIMQCWFCCAKHAAAGEPEVEKRDLELSHDVIESWQKVTSDSYHLRVENDRVQGVVINSMAIPFTICACQVESLTRYQCSRYVGKVRCKDWPNYYPCRSGYRRPSVFPSYLRGGKAWAMLPPLTKAVIKSRAVRIEVYRKAGMPG